MRRMLWASRTGLDKESDPNTLIEEVGRKRFKLLCDCLVLDIYMRCQLQSFHNTRRASRRDRTDSRGPKRPHSTGQWRAPKLDRIAQ